MKQNPCTSVRKQDGGGSETQIEPAGYSFDVILSTEGVGWRSLLSIGFPGIRWSQLAAMVKDSSDAYPHAQAFPGPAGLVSRR